MFLALSLKMCSSPGLRFFKRPCVMLRPNTTSDCSKLRTEVTIIIITYNNHNIKFCVCTYIITIIANRFFLKIIVYNTNISGNFDTESS